MAIDQANRSSGWPASTSCPEVTSTPATIAVALGADLVEDLHRLDDAQGRAGLDGLARCHEGRLVRATVQIDDAEQRRAQLAGRGLRRLAASGRAGAGQPTGALAPGRTDGCDLSAALVAATSRSDQPSSTELHLGEVGGRHRVDE